ncbi:lipid-A-disaccharide synthase [Endomicrobium proavitum]|uniref:Lipid-A-disaccharide synthase n=1 Tax=Endomicrobium proavitum TaxID=1408281 RepID=A0A0G3WGN0_9BACT|nr:lipid-A-disaccharide synthase [Endomicrobium proavitum]AKL97836.1 putative Lipid-A-disaccharide synthase [Endomicrobium proavitum]
MPNNRIFISAGDLSGEIHAANLIREIKKIAPSCFIESAGGDNLKSVSDSFIEDIVNINAFGFFVVNQIFFLKKVLKKIENSFKENKPDKVILVDYYGFNIFVGRLAKKFNIPVYYYVSPQVWASRAGRIKKLKEVVRKMFVIFPFEEKLYKDNGVDAVFVGNPLIDKISAKDNFEISNPPVVGLFPGSRKSVVKKHIPILLETAKILREKLNANFIIFSAGKNFEFSNKVLPDYIQLVSDNNQEKRKSVNIAVCPSGTVSLENALFGIPMVVMYKLAYFNYFIMRLIAKVKYITIVNILANKEIVPEFIQHAARAENIANAVIEQLNPNNYRQKVSELLSFRQALGAPGVSKRTAELIATDK